MNTNIYDLQISELILRLGTATATNNNGSPSAFITNDRNTTQVAENFNSAMTFTSTIINIPSGYTVKLGTHKIDYPTATPDTTGSSTTLTGTDTVILGAIGSTYTVTVTATLEHSTDPDILITTTQVITAVSPIYYGVKPFELTPNTTGLSTIAESDSVFKIASSVVGRLFIVIPTTQSNLLTVTSPNGLIIPVSDFTLTTIGSLKYYQLNYDTQLTGSNLKSFTINYI